MSNDFPRRIQMQKWVPAERAIWDAIQVVERLGADLRLTDAVILLGKAKDKVADYVDAPSSPPPPSPTQETREGNWCICEDCAPTPSSPETPELRTLIDELLETRRRIASGECASFDEAAYLAEVEDDLRAKISALYNRQREDELVWVTHTKTGNRVQVTAKAAFDAAAAEVLSLSSQLERLKAERMADTKRLDWIGRNFPALRMNVDAAIASEEK